jgi:5-formyltetrahydrofolate cyclo-ligase
MRVVKYECTTIQSSTVLLNTPVVSHQVPNVQINQQAAENIIQHCLNLDEEEQKDICLAALASNNLEMIAALTTVRQRNANVLLAKLTKKLLTHSEQHKTTELKYSENASR